jgi:DHA1 family tetracycline resistance protein-like MFS transporter
MDPAPRRATFAFIFFVVLLDVLSLGIIIPVLPFLLTGFLGGDAGRAAEINGHFNSAWALMQLIFAPLLGALSDRWGRRPVILLSCAGLGLDYFFMAAAPSLALLFVGRVVSGITAASFATAGAYVADVTAPERRSGAFGMLGAAWGLGFVLGPALGGFLGGISPRLPFAVAGALTLANALYGIFILPESLPPERRAPFRWSRANPLGSLALLRSHPRLFGLSAVHFLYQLAHQVLPTVFVLYAGFRFRWKESAVGALLAAVGVCNILVQGLLVKRAVARLGERACLLLGLLSGAAGFAVYGLAPDQVVFWLGVPVFAFMGLFGPAAQALMTRRVDPTEQGGLQGALGSLAGFAGIAGPALFSHVFSAALRPDAPWALPGAPFLVAAALMVLAAALGAFASRPET